MTSIISFLIIGLISIAQTAAIDSKTKDVSIEMIIPRSQTRSEYLQSIIDYWTPERMASAKPKETVSIDESSLSKLINDRKPDEAERILVSSDVLRTNLSTLPSTSGKVYFVMNRQNFLCSGSVVNADNRDTVVTAGHCVFDFVQQIWASNWIFVPEYSRGSRPYGTFTWRRLATKQGWTSFQNWNFDVGIVLMNTNANGQHVQDVTGGLGITLNPSRQAATNAFGYPKNINNGETMSTCSGTSLSPTFVTGFTGLQLVCNMTGGASGGPWIQDFNTNTRFGQQVSVTSFIILNRPNNLFGPYFHQDNIGSLYQTYQNQ